MNTTEKILVDASEAARLLSIGKSTLWREVSKGTIPAPIKISGLTRWRLTDLRQFFQPAGQQSTV